MDHIPRLSEVLYVGLCRKIGTPTEVAIRRDVLDMEEMIMKPVYNQIGYVMVESGSYREGFRMRSSDRDRMLWFCNYKLITDVSQSRLYNSSKHTIVLIENSDTPPGFVKLRLLIPVPLSYIVFFDSGAYLSSRLWREKHFQFLLKSSSKSYPLNLTIQMHGPCSNSILGPFELDIGWCLASFPWPKLLRSCIERCQRHTWPSTSVLEKILKNECHCMPIGSKVESPYNELEWRLSFSKAEQQLVCSMNHTQFLCYGLLKLFLKEVINYNKEPILCSYYIKTTMFWMMQSGQVRWCPNNLLDCFWRCFKYLIYCVYRGVFPNFFIPQNNMFIKKVNGDARELLLQQLYQYYRMGVSCLLLSPTLRSILEPALSSPSFVLSPAEGEFIRIADSDMCAMYELSMFHFFLNHILELYLYLKSIATLYRTSLSSYQLLTLQYCNVEPLVRLSFIMANSTSCYTHKNIYNLDTKICGMLKIAATLGPVSYLLYLALYYYRTGRYDKTLYITNITQQRLSQNFNIYSDTVDRLKYNQALSNVPLSMRMKKTWVKNIDLIENILYIEELYIEQLVNKQSFLRVSPFVMVEMLSVLSHYRLGNRSQCLQSLTDLQTLLLYDDGTYVPLYLRDLSWQILGICQHVVGDLHGALRSYEESLKQKPYNKLNEATEFRIECVKQQLQRNV